MGVHFNHDMSGSATAGVLPSSTVCSRVLPVCQHRLVLYPLGIATPTIDQTRSCCRRRDHLTKQSQSMNLHASFQPQIILHSVTDPILNSRFICLFFWGNDFSGAYFLPDMWITALRTLGAHHFDHSSVRVKLQHSSKQLSALHE